MLTLVGTSALRPVNSRNFGCDFLLLIDVNELISYGCSNMSQDDQIW